MLIIFFSCKERKGRHNLTKSELETISSEYDLPTSKTFILNTKYIDYILSMNKIHTAEQLRNHYQPLQAVYYNKQGQLVSFHTNCYAGAYGNDSIPLNWNHHKIFEKFPPKTSTPIDSILPLSKHLQYIQTFDRKPIDTAGFAEFDYTIIVHWVKNWKAEEVKSLIKFVTGNSKLAGNKKINLLFVNNDDYWE